MITGGDFGIGRSAAIAYAREGADIALQFYPGEEPDAKQVAKYVEEAGRKAVLLPFDLRDAAAPEKNGGSSSERIRRIRHAGVKHGATDYLAFFSRVDHGASPGYF